MHTETLNIEGMSCGHCVKAVQHALDQIPGVTVETVAIGSATVQYDPEETPRDAIVEAVEDAGYEVTSRSHPAA